MSEFGKTLTIISGFLTPIIAVITVYIAYQQYRTAKKRLKLDLYEKRFKVYYSLMEFLSSIIQNHNITGEKLNKFLVDTSESIFLFDKEIYDYLNLVYKQACDKWIYNRNLDDMDVYAGKERNTFAQASQELDSWFAAQLKESKERFMKYLYFQFE